MRADIVAGVVFPDYELTDHAGKRRTLSDLQGPDPMVLVLSRGGYCPKDLRQAAELSLNASILRAEIAGSYEEFLDIFETFYADDGEVSREDLPEMIRGKARLRPFLLNVLVPLHVMAEVAGLSISVQQTAVPGDRANETHSAWRIDFSGGGGRRCTLKWHAT